MVLKPNNTHSRCPSAGQGHKCLVDFGASAGPEIRTTERLHHRLPDLRQIRLFAELQCRDTSKLLDDAFPESSSQQHCSKIGHRRWAVRFRRRFRFECCTSVGSYSGVVGSCRLWIIEEGVVSKNLCRIFKPNLTCIKKNYIYTCLPTLQSITWNIWWNKHNGINKVTISLKCNFKVNM